MAPRAGSAHLIRASKANIVEGFPFAGGTNASYDNIAKHAGEILKFVAAIDHDTILQAQALEHLEASARWRRCTVFARIDDSFFGATVPAKGVPHLVEP